MIAITCKGCGKKSTAFYVPCLTGFGASFYEADDRSWSAKGGEWRCGDCKDKPAKPDAQTRKEVK